jgi:hypothetical protein
MLCSFAQMGKVVGELAFASDALSQRDVDSSGDSMSRTPTGDQGRAQLKLTS